MTLNESMRPLKEALLIILISSFVCNAELNYDNGTLEIDPDGTNIAAALVSGMIGAEELLVFLPGTVLQTGFQL